MGGGEDAKGSGPNSSMCGGRSRVPTFNSILTLTSTQKESDPRGKGSVLQDCPALFRCQSKV